MKLTDACALILRGSERPGLIGSISLAIIDSIFGGFLPPFFSSTHEYYEMLLLN
jgi:hypothetical protein